MSISMQVHVGPQVDSIEALYLWDENHPWQAHFGNHGPEGWYLVIEHKEAENPDVELMLDEIEWAVGSFPSLHAAMEVYAVHPWAIPGFAENRTQYGGFVIG